MENTKYSFNEVRVIFLYELLRKGLSENCTKITTEWATFADEVFATKLDTSHLNALSALVAVLETISGIELLPHVRDKRLFPYSLEQLLDALDAYYSQADVPKFMKARLESIVQISEYMRVARNLRQMGHRFTTAEDAQWEIMGKFDSLVNMELTSPKTNMAEPFLTALLTSKVIAHGLNQNELDKERKPIPAALWKFLELEDDTAQAGRHFYTHIVFEITATKKKKPDARINALRQKMRQDFKNRKGPVDWDNYEKDLEKFVEDHGFKPYAPGGLRQVMTETLEGFGDDSYKRRKPGRQKT